MPASSTDPTIHAPLREEGTTTYKVFRILPESFKPSTWTPTCKLQDFYLKRHEFYLKLTRFQGLLPESQGQNLAVSVLHVPYSLDSGTPSSTDPTIHVPLRCELSSEYGIQKTVKASFRPWLSGKSA